MSRPHGDVVLVRDAARAVALRVAFLVAAAMLAVIAIAAVFVVRQQNASADAMLRRAAATVDDVGDPPPFTWIVIASASSTETSPGLPGELSDRLRALRSTVAAHPSLVTLHRDDDTYRVITRREADGVVQVVLDRAPAMKDRAELLRAMGAVSALALLFAAGLGVVVGRRAVRPLAEALTLQRSFVADASHELRTPLTLLSTRAQLLDRELDGRDLPPGVREDSRGIVHDVQRLGEVVEDLLVAADPRADIEHVPLDVTSLVRAAVESAHAHAFAAGVHLSGPEDEAPAAELHVLGTAAALRRALLALVDNAVDHTPSGGSVRVRVRRERRDVVIAVSDTGPGIAPGEAGRVMRRFHSGGQRSARSHYGLGLALTHDVAARHGGQLRLAGGGPGACFELVLPAAQL
jgi:signal transduction histidine kinase